MTTCGISVFITNTATAAMMLPIVNAILEELKGLKSKKHHYKSNADEEMALMYKP